MDTSKLQRPTAAPAVAGPEPAVAPVQVLQSEGSKEDTLDKSVEVTVEPPRVPKKAPNAGMKNYFVSLEMNLYGPKTDLWLASVQLRHQARLVFDSVMLSLVYRFRYHIPVDECRVRYVQKDSNIQAMLIHS
jgi:hypothetical protein